jgi:hypothetical protein
VWRKTSQVFLGQHAHAARLAETAVDYDSDQAGYAVESKSGPSAGQAATGQYASAAAVVSAFAGAAQQPRGEGSMQHVSSADRIVEDAAVHIQLRHFSETAAKQQPVSAGPGPQAMDSLHLLHQQPASSAAPSPTVSWLKADLLKAHQHQHQQQHQHKRQQQQHSDQPGRQHSYEQFAAERMPSILGEQQQSRSGSKAGSKAGSRAGSRYGQGLLRGGQTTSKYSNSSARRMPLPGMVAGVDGLLLQPEVLGASGAADGQVSLEPPAS